MPVVKVLLITLALVVLGGLSLIVLGWALQHLTGGVVWVGIGAEHLCRWQATRDGAQCRWWFSLEVLRGA